MSKGVEYPSNLLRCQLAVNTVLQVDTVKYMVIGVLIGSVELSFQDNAGASNTVVLNAVSNPTWKLQAPTKESYFKVSVNTSSLGFAGANISWITDDKRVA